MQGSRHKSASSIALRRSRADHVWSNEDYDAGNDRVDTGSLHPEDPGNRTKIFSRRPPLAEPGAVIELADSLDGYLEEPEDGTISEEEVELNGFGGEQEHNSDFSAADTDSPWSTQREDPEYFDGLDADTFFDDDDINPRDVEDLGGFLSSFEDDIELPDYQPGAKQKPYDPVPDALIASHTVRIAAKLVEAFDIRHRVEYESCINVLADILATFPHGASLRAIRNLIDSGVDAPSLSATAKLKTLWLETPEWWMSRRFIRNGRGTLSIEVRADGPNLLTWKLAHRICELRSDHPVEHMIDPDWYEDWLALEPGDPGFWLFAQYLDHRVGSAAVDLLEAGLGAVASHGDLSELFDQRDWPVHSLHRFPADPYFAGKITPKSLI